MKILIAGSRGLVGSAVTRHLTESGYQVTRPADTGGGNIEVLLPENVANLQVAARTGAGNVTVRIPGNVAACIQATTGLGTVNVDPRLIKTGETRISHLTSRVPCTRSR